MAQITTPMTLDYPARGCSNRHPSATARFARSRRGLRRFSAM